MNDTKYRITEIFQSIQGEGSGSGRICGWVRNFSCNLKCPGFKCDSEYSWNKEYLPNTQVLTATEIFNQLKELFTTESNPTGSLTHPLTNNTIDLVFTGGEPLLVKNQQMIIEVVNLFRNENDMVNFTIETNGTQKLTPAFKEWINNVEGINCLLSVSPKMESSSGEQNAVNIDNLCDYILDTSCGIQFKLVANDTDECQDEIIQFVKDINNAVPGEFRDAYEFWVMPVGETREDQLKVAPIVERYQVLGFHIATRNHVYIWSNEIGR